MYPTTAELVDVFFSRGWYWRDELRAAQPGSAAAAQAELGDLLRRISAADNDELREPCLLGIAYPLACWFDQQMADDSRTAQAWNDFELEPELFGSSDREWRFWQQVETAEELGYERLLHVALLCVAHGFPASDALPTSAAMTTERDWVDRMRTRFSRPAAPDLPSGRRLGIPPDVPPLHGRRAMHSMLAAGWLASMVILPTLCYVGTSLWLRL